MARVYLELSRGVLVRAICRVRAAGVSGIYMQFRHLSFQEGLCAQKIMSDDISAWVSNSKQVRKLMLYGVNVIRIIGDPLVWNLPAKLDLSSSLTSKNKIDDEAMRVLGDMLLRSTEGQLRALKCDAFDLRADAMALDLRAKGIGSGAATMLAGVVQFNTTMTSLDLTNNNLGPEGGKAIAKMLEFNTTMTKCNLKYNNLDAAAKHALREAVKGRKGFELKL